MKFLDPNKPIATCISKTCDDCTVRDALHCHFKFRDLIHFLFIASPAFLLGGGGIYHINGWMLIPWLILIIGYFGFVEIRVMCSHCPYYWLSIVSTRGLSSDSRRFFYDIKNVSLFSVYEFRMPIEYSYE
jgi:hypothetical protein